MAQFTSYVTPFPTGETKENLDSKLNLLVQMETPVYSSIGRGTTMSRAPQLIEDTIAAAGLNAFNEGAAFNSDALATAGQARRTFNTQIFRKDIEVSASEEATDAVRYDGKRRMAEQVALRGMELKRDIEFAIIAASGTGNANKPGNGAGSAGTGATSGGPGTAARGITDYWNQIAAAADRGRPATAYTPGDAIDDPSVGTNFEDAINVVAERLYMTGGLSYNMGNSFVKNANMLVMSPARKVNLDTRLDAKTNTRRDIGNMKMLNSSYTKYGSSFGDFAIVPDIHCDNANVAVFNPQNWKWVTLRDTQKVDIAKVGDADRAFLVHEGTLIHRNTFASGSIVGLQVG